MCNSEVGAVSLALSNKRREVSRRAYPPWGGPARIKSYIDQHLFEESLCVKSTLALCGISDHNFTTRFRLELGLSIKAYIEAARINAACSLLKTSNFSILEIALAVGYEHIQTFYRCFRRRMHCAPGDYRKQVIIPTSVDHRSHPGL
jgi:AraC-like DNA-binding protein